MPKSKAEREQRNQYGTHWVSLSAVTLTLAATPLGNPRDASQRLREAIEGAAIVAAEDSRKFHRLCADMEVEFGGRVISFFEGNESDRTEEILKLLREGHSVLVVSDAGMPTISDPGFRLMRAAIAENIEVSVLPGPSAVTMAIALSGLPTDRFVFEGFSPRSSGAREKFLKSCEMKSAQLFGLKHHTDLRKLCTMRFKSLVKIDSV